MTRLPVLSPAGHLAGPPRGHAVTLCRACERGPATCTVGGVPLCLFCGALAVGDTPLEPVAPVVSRVLGAVAAGRTLAHPCAECGAECERPADDCCDSCQRLQLAAAGLYGEIVS